MDSKLFFLVPRRFLPVDRFHFHSPPAPVYHQEYLTIMYVSGAGKTEGRDHARTLSASWPGSRNSGAQQRLIYCRKKWDGKGIDIREICRGLPADSLNM